MTLCAHSIALSIPEIEFRERTEAMTPTELTDDIYTEALAELRHDDAFLAALDAGEMDDAAQASIQSAMVRVLERREQMKAHYLEDSDLRDSLHAHYMARSRSAIAAQDAFVGTMKALGRA